MNRSQSQADMSVIVKTVCEWVQGFILMYGIYIILYGHLTPGGGFAGGVIAAAAFVLIALAKGEQTAIETYSRKAAATWDSLGVLLFWLLAVLGITVAGVFFFNFWTTPESARLTLFSSGIIPPCNIGIGLKVCSSLYLVVLVLTAHRLGSEPAGKEDETP
jgi:multicomponent Na+:H+ antiporter subunit B